jgi:sensor c-di-GMP phosphodiesterase-like protein
MPVHEGHRDRRGGGCLRNFGCDIAQGYWYAKPMPRAAFQTWLEGKEREELTDMVSLAIY